MDASMNILLPQANPFQSVQACDDTGNHKLDTEKINVMPIKQDKNLVLSEQCRIHRTLKSSFPRRMYVAFREESRHPKFNVRFD